MPSNISVKNGITAAFIHITGSSNAELELIQGFWGEWRHNLDIERRPHTFTCLGPVNSSNCKVGDCIDFCETGLCLAHFTGSLLNEEKNQVCRKNYISIKCIFQFVIIFLPLLKLLAANKNAVDISSLVVSL